MADILKFDPTPKYESKTLDNGLKVMVVPNHEVPFVTCWLGIRNGAWTESKPGTASMTLGMLTRGTEKHTEAELADELETYAINLSGNGGMDNSTVRMSCLTDHLERAVGLMAEVVCVPIFDKKEFFKLKKQVRTGLAISSHEPSYIADRIFRMKLYGQHPYARTATGEIQDIDVLTIDDLKQWWKTYARPDMSRLIFAGDIDLDRAVALAEKEFGQWKADGPAPGASLAQVPSSGNTHIYLVDQAGVQSQIRIGQKGLTRQDPAYFLSRVVSGYFGGAFNSRLNETIRVEKGLTYGARGGYSAQRFAGKFQISTFSKTATTAEAVEAALGEIKRLQNEPPDDDELNHTKSYIVGSFAARRETPQQMASDLWLLEANDLPGDYFEQLLKHVAEADKDACISLARDTLHPDKMMIVVVGSASKLKSKLEKIAPVTVLNTDGTDAETPAEPENVSQ